MGSSLSQTGLRLSFRPGFICVAMHDAYIYGRIENEHVVSKVSSASVRSAQIGCWSGDCSRCSPPRLHDLYVLKRHEFLQCKLFSLDTMSRSTNSYTWHFQAACFFFSFFWDCRLLWQFKECRKALKMIMWIWSPYLLNNSSRFHVCPNY